MATFSAMTVKSMMSSSFHTPNLGCRPCVQRSLSKNANLAFGNELSAVRSLHSISTNNTTSRSPCRSYEPRRPSGLLAPCIWRPLILAAAGQNSATSGQSLQTMSESSKRGSTSGVATQETEWTAPNYDSFEEDAIAAENAPHPYVNLIVGDRWREIQGADNWDGLLDPMDPVLRGEATRYGDFAQATYDGFDNDPFSAFVGSCKYTREDFFERLYLKNRGYEVRSFLYATAEASDLPFFFKLPADAVTNDNWTKVSNWMGFVAVCTSPEEIKRLGRRDIVVAWRGTVTQFEWIENIKVSLVPTASLGKDVGAEGAGFTKGDLKVEGGFLNLYETSNAESKFNKNSARTQLKLALQQLVEEFKDEELSITLTGHSLGAALATLSAFDIAQLKINVRSTGASDTLGTVPITVFTWGSPRVGNNGFLDRINELKVRVMRVANVHDLVPQVPGLFFNMFTVRFFNSLPTWLANFFLIKFIENTLDLLPGTYIHVGVEIPVDNLQSTAMNRSLNPGDAHNLEAYLHLLDGYQGKTSGGFNLEIVQRDLTLINKSSSLLTVDHKIPPKWSQRENKGLVRNKVGRFYSPGRDPVDYPQTPINDDKSYQDLDIPKTTDQ